MNTATKPCFKCGEEKPLDEFYRHPKMIDGRVNKCKGCTKIDVRANRAANAEYYRAYDRQRANDPKRVVARKEYLRTEKGASARKKASSEWDARNAHKKKCTGAVSNAIRDGKLERESCEICGGRAQAHHDDYSKPLEVRWLCPKHHAAHHKAERQKDRMEHKGMPVLNFITKSGSLARLGTFKCLPIEQFKAYIRQNEIHWVNC